MSKKVSVLITEPAQSDITVIADYIAKNNPRAAVGFLNILEETFKVIAKYPFAGTQKIGVKYNSVFIYTTRKRYSIVYRLKDNNLEILRVLTKYQDLFAII